MTDARILLGDCIAIMQTLEPESIDAVVTDPPYGIEFMGKDWDKFIPHDRVEMSPRWANAKRTDPATTHWGDGESAKFGKLPSFGGRRNSYQCQACGKRDAFRNPHKCGDDADWRVVPSYAGASPDVLAFEEFSKAWATEAYRVLKPGGHVLAFGATRMYHRLTSGIEDAGFEIRDSLHWIYGSGFPKSLDVSRAIDKKAGADRPDRVTSEYGENEVFSPTKAPIHKGTPVTDDAQRWDGWGTALKPAHEPIVLARKPLGGTVTENVLAHGTGALNIAATREGDDAGWSYPNGPRGNTGDGVAFGGRALGRREDAVKATGGRWPANVLLAHVSYAVLRLRDNIPDGAAAAIGSYYEGYARVSELRRRLHGAEGVGKGRSPEVLQSGVQVSSSAHADGRAVAAVREEAHGDVEGADGGTSSGGRASGAADEPMEGRSVSSSRVSERPGSASVAGGSGVGEGDDAEPVRVGASASGSADARPSTATRGTGASSQRRAGRQPAGESAGHRVGGALAATSESRTGTVEAASGERPLEVLACDVPAGWLSYFFEVERIECEGSGAAHTDVLCADGCPVAELNEASGDVKSTRMAMPLPIAPGDARGEAHGDRDAVTVRGYDDDGGAARFFYIAKPRKRERVGGTIRNLHPTVKPIDLMRHLVRLVTPPGGVVLDPFLGSGSTGCAAMVEGFRFVGIEADAASHETSLARISDYAFAHGRERPVTD